MYRTALPHASVLGSSQFQHRKHSCSLFSQSARIENKTRVEPSLAKLPNCTVHVEIERYFVGRMLDPALTRQMLPWLRCSEVRKCLPTKNKKVVDLPKSLETRDPKPFSLHKF
jgi:hypothetical protein